jgi:phage terminase large subunit-like protein
VPGNTISYDWVAEYLKVHTDGMDINQVLFDRWRIKEFQSACDRAKFAPNSWKEVGQGYKDFSPAIENFENFLLDEKIYHGSHPLLNLAISSAIAVMDPAGNRKLDKSRQSARIDPIVAAIMACANLRSLNAFDVNALIA